MATTEFRSSPTTDHKLSIAIHRCPPPPPRRKLLFSFQKADLSLKMDGDATVGVEAFSRIAPAVRVVANVVVSDKIFEMLAASTSNRLHFAVYDKYLIRLESEEEAKRETYSVCTTTHTGFRALIFKELSCKSKALALKYTRPIDTGDPPRAKCWCSSTSGRAINPSQTSSFFGPRSLLYFNFTKNPPHLYRHPKSSTYMTCNYTNTHTTLAQYFKLS